MTDRGKPARPRPLRGAEADTMVTGEAVLIDIPPASLPIRAVARVIDTILYLLLVILLLVVVVAQSSDASVASSETLALISIVGSLLVVPVAVETLTRGRSLGKLICRLRVVRDDGGPIVFRHAFVRGLVGVVEFFVAYGIPAVIAAIATTRVKRLGDLAAGTYVVHEDVRLQLSAPPEVPWRLEPWARAADISALPDGVALAVRQFLLRRRTLTPAARARLSTELTAAVRPNVAPPPPPGTPDEDFLAAVLAERRRRDQQRLARDSRLRARVVPVDELTGR
ncbi:RDD family protein [Allobranchiibius sp. CTAmp26]|uniref:RDD family protein n=1 Tax=Allobranchiibius sp. CTAmp26 TaxID=2815214 RepID=UPI0027DD8646|nr:RDD family protein [Allobranchiibius sp. CTAmp26]